jgi:nucleoside-diphosphate-sugar epimerase
MRICVTGASGFVGQALCAELLRQGRPVRSALRQRGGRPALPQGGEAVVVNTLDAATDWSAALADCSAVVHLAARVHVMRDEASDLLAEFRKMNTEGTLNLARQAAQAGVKRFVFVSTIKVNGEGRDTPYRETDPAAPEDAYAISKWEAEQGLQQIARETGLEIVILRPPLVYGPGVKANFLRLMQMVQRAWPLPLGAIRNRRSFLYLGNFVDAIRVCIEHPDAAGQTFLLDDGEPVSTPELVRALAHAVDRPARLWAVPVRALELAGALVGKRATVTRLTGSLYVDNSTIRSRLGWTPPHTLAQGLAATVADWQGGRGSGSGLGNPR